MTSTTTKSSLIFPCVVLTFIIVSCGLSLTGQHYYENGLKAFKLADHGDYHDQKGLEMAVKDFERAIKKGYTNRDVFDKLTWSYHFLNHNLKNAERVYTVGLKYFPEDIEFYSRRGDDRKKLRKYKEAFNDFDKAITLDTAKHYKYINDVIYDRGAMRYILGDTITAYIDLQTAQKITEYELRTYDDYCRAWK